MNYNGNDPIPSHPVVVMVDGVTPAYFDYFLSGGELAALIDPKDHHRYIISASRVPI